MITTERLTQVVDASGTENGFDALADLFDMLDEKGIDLSALVNDYLDSTD